jgi:hypothetical protein
MGEKKTLFVLLVVLAIVAVVGALYFFNVLKTPESVLSIDDDIKYRQVYSIKETAVNNIIDFMKTKNNPDSVLENFYNDAQYVSLKELIIEINLEDGIGNETPFNPLEFAGSEEESE